MEILATSLARVIAYVEFVTTVDPHGQLLVEESIEALRKNYSFGVYPQKLADLNIMERPIVLAQGKFGDVAIERIEFHKDGIIVDTRSSTENCEAILADLFAFAKSGFGVNIQSPRKIFLSQIIVRAGLRLGLFHPALAALADRISSSTSSALKQTFKYETTAILIGHDDTLTRLVPPVFSIERRSNVPFGENVYFSSAPVTTSEHLELLHDVEIAFVNHGALPVAGE